MRHHHNPYSSKNFAVPETRNRNVRPHVTKGEVVIKTPVVLAELTVQIDIDSTIDFPEPVLEIKDIKKRVKLTQCRLLLPTNKLFLKGFVRKNIQFATAIHGNAHEVESKLRSLTVDVPFTAVTKVDLINEPVFHTNKRREFEFLVNTPLPSGFSSKDVLEAGDLSEFDQMSTEVFNELPFCELVKAKIVEFDEALDREQGIVHNHNNVLIEAPFEEGSFTKIEEKMVLDLTLKVLQNQQVRVSSC